MTNKPIEPSQRRAFGFQFYQPSHFQFISYFSSQPFFSVFHRVFHVTLIFHLSSLLLFRPPFEVLTENPYRNRDNSVGIFISSKYLFGIFWLFAVHFYNDVAILRNWALFLFSSQFGVCSDFFFCKNTNKGC